MAEHVTVKALLEVVAPMGVGGLLAMAMFLFYRKDVLQVQDFWKGQSEHLLNVVKENTASNVKLVSAVDAFHARLDREQGSTR